MSKRSVLIIVFTVILSHISFSQYEHPLRHYEPFQLGELLIQDIKNGTNEALSSSENIAFIFDKYQLPKLKNKPSESAIATQKKAAYAKMEEKYQNDIASIQKQMNGQQLKGLLGFDVISRQVLTSNKPTGFGAPLAKDKLVHIEHFQVQFYLRDRVNRALILASIFNVNGEYKLDNILRTKVSGPEGALFIDFREDEVASILNDWDYKKVKKLCGETISKTDDEIIAWSKLQLTENGKSTTVRVAPEPKVINGTLTCKLGESNLQTTIQYQLAEISGRLSAVLSSWESDVLYFNYQVMTGIQQAKSADGKALFTKPLEFRESKNMFDDGITGELKAAFNPKIEKWELTLTIESGGGFLNPFRE